MPLPFRSLFAALALLLAAPPAWAADLRVLTAGAYKSVLTDVAEAFQAQTHDRLAISNDTAGVVSARVLGGEAADLVILPLPALEALVTQGKVVAGTPTPLAKSGIGVAIREGAPIPDIGSVEAFRAAVLAAPSVAYIDPAAGGSSGIYLARLFERLGMAESLRGRTVLVPGGLTAARVVSGEAAMAIQQISELRAVSGVTYVGPLPAAIQNHTVYAGGVPVTARDPEASRALLRFLRGEAATKAVTAHGLEAP